MTYRRAEIAASLALLLLSGLGWSQLADLPRDAAMFPGALLIAIAALSALMLGRALLGRAAHLVDDKARNWRFALSWPRMCAGFAMLAGFLLVVPLLGFFTTSLVFIVLMAWSAGYRDAGRLIAVAIGFEVFVYLIFVALFDRPLPEELLLTLFSAAP